MSMKNSNDTIGNRTRDFPANSAVRQPNAPPSSPKEKGGHWKLEEEALNHILWRTSFGRDYGLP